MHLTAYPTVALLEMVDTSAASAIWLYLSYHRRWYPVDSCEHHVTQLEKRPRPPAGLLQVPKEEADEYIAALTRNQPMRNQPTTGSSCPTI
jgi:hypothetical protein